MLVCDGLKGPARGGRDGLAEHDVQTCVVHLLRNSFSAMLPARTGTRSPRSSSPSTRRRPRRPLSGSRSLPTPGAGSIR
ncbi:hypothetical protein [Streptomyces tendae]|uniref:hypothetical protein n=1 Tax=Streptomyces tendae TaxID=1932 RepID=UPI0023EF9C54|nr:hypothetical protein [Streptomyces tendae]